MKNLKPILNALNTKELASIRLKLEDQPQTGRRLELLNLLSSIPTLTDQEAAEILYQSAPNSAFSHLKARLQQSILNALFPFTPVYQESKYDNKRQECWRKIFIGHFFINRGAVDFGNSQLDQARDIAEEHGLIVEIPLIEDLLLKQSSNLTMPLTNGSNKTEFTPQFMGTKVEQYLQAQQEFQQVSQIDRFYNYHSNSLQPYEDLALNGLRKSIDMDIAPRIAYLYQASLTILAKAHGHYKQALDYAKRLYMIAYAKQSHFSLTEHLEATLIYAQLAILAGRPGVGIDFTTLILDQAPKGSLIELKIFETKFLLSFYEGDQLAAQEILDLALSHPLLKDSPFYFGLWHYYQSHMILLQKGPSQSLQALNNCRELLKYKTKWLLGYKSLELYNCILLKEYDLAEYKLAAFKQLLKRQKSHQIARAKLICRVISYLSRNNYDFPATRTYLKEQLTLSELWDTSCHWTPLNYEVLNIERFLIMGEQGF